MRRFITFVLLVLVTASSFGAESFRRRLLFAKAAAAADAGPAIYWPLDESGAVDRVPCIGTGTLTSGTKPNSNTGKISNAVTNVAASSQYLAVADSSTTSMGANQDFSIACWVWMNSTGIGTTQPFVSKDSGTDEYWLGFINGVGINFRFWDAGGTQRDCSSVSASYTANQWYHIVMTHTASDDKYYIYVNGSLDNTITQTGDPRDSTSDFEVGHSSNAGAYLDGAIDELGVWKRALSSTEVSNMYSGGSPDANDRPPGCSTSSTLNTGLTAYWKMDEASGTRVDSGSNGQDLTDTTTVPSTTGKISNGGAFEFDDGEHLTHTDSPTLSVSDQDFTFVCWVNMESKPAFNGGIISKEGAGDANNDEYGLYWNATSDRFEISAGNGSAATIVTANTFGAPSTATWYMLIFGYEAATDTLFISVNNGTADTGSLNPGPFNSNGDFLLGGRTFQPLFAFDGVIDEVGFWKRLLTSGEKTEIYNSGSGKTCCPF